MINILIFVLKGIFSMNFYANVCGVTLGDVRQTRSFENTDFRNTRIAEAAIKSSSSNNSIRCAESCGQDKSCLSFSYNSVSKICKLYDVDILTSSSDRETGNKYYYIIRDCPHTEMSCPSSKGYIFDTQLCFCYKLYSSKQDYDSSTQICQNDDAAMARINRGLRQRKLEEVLSDCPHTEMSCPSSKGYIFDTQLCFCYKLYSSKQDYDSSTQICQNDDAAMARINRGLRQRKLEEVLSGVTSYAETYIQGTRTSNSATWYYDDGTEVTYFNWNTADGQPQLRTNGENYLLVRKTKGYRWHDVYANEKHIVMCEI